MKKDLLQILLVVTFAASMALNVMQYRKEQLIKKEIARLVLEKSETPSKALKSLYTDSINNRIANWLEDGKE